MKHLIGNSSRSFLIGLAISFGVASAALADGILPRYVLRQMPNQFEVIGKGELPGWAKGGLATVHPSEKWTKNNASAWFFDSAGTVRYTNVPGCCDGQTWSFQSPWLLVRDKPSGAVGVATYLTDPRNKKHARIFFDGGLQVAPTSSSHTIQWGWQRLK